MSNSLQNTLALIGRILLAFIFVRYGFDKIVSFEGTARYIASKGLPMPAVLATLALIVELGGGLLVVVGLFTRWAALALAVFCFMTAFLFHPYWSLPAANQMAEQISFWKDLALAGGLLVLAAFGPGTISFDARRSRA